MNGIDKVAGRILSDAEAEARAIRDEAEKRSRELMAAANRDAEELKQKLLAEGEEAAERQFRLAVSNQETAEKKETLRLKQELLTEAFDRAVLRLRALEGEKYVSLLARLALDACETGKEEIILNPKDRAQYGEKLMERLQAEGKEMTLSPETRPLVGGLILSQGRIEVNCALDTLARLRRSELSAGAAELLFD